MRSHRKSVSPWLRPERSSRRPLSVTGAEPKTLTASHLAPSRRTVQVQFWPSRTRSPSSGATVFAPVSSEVVSSNGMWPMLAPLVARWA
jgi:hypothetical protein